MFICVTKMRYIKRIPILTAVKFKNLPFFFFFFIGTSSFYFLEITATQIQDIEVYLSVNVVLKAGVTRVSHKDLK